jgi:hypothetical protein
MHMVFHDFHRVNRQVILLGNLLEHLLGIFSYPQVSFPQARKLVCSLSSTSVIYSI